MVPRWLLILFWALPIVTTVTSELRFAQHKAWEHHSDAEVRLMVQREDYQMQRDRRSKAVTREENIRTACVWTLEKNAQGKIVAAYREISGPALTLFESDAAVFKAAKELFEGKQMTDGTITKNESGPWE